MNSRRTRDDSTILSRSHRAANLRCASEVRAQIPGPVIEVRVAVGDRVSAGTTMIVLEAMKMQNEIRAESSARVARVECAVGDPVEAGALLLRLEPEESPES